MLTGDRRASIGRPLVFAHRGGCALGPENTIAAFDRGLAAGADGIECDVRLSRDGIVVVHHDATLDRTTNATGVVSHRTADELRLVDAAYGFKPEENYPLRSRGVGVPRLRDVLSRYPQASFIIELKEKSGALARAVVEDLRSANAVDRAWVGSYLLSVLRLTRRAEPQLRTGAALPEVRWALWMCQLGRSLGRCRYTAFQVPESFGKTTVVTPALLKMAHASGVAVHVWTIDREEDIRRLIAWGVDGIITDRPDVAVPIVKELEAEP